MNIREFQKKLTHSAPDFWEQKGQAHALRLFKLMSNRVPAYQHFLKKNNVNAKKINSFEDFKSKVPIISKDSYLRQYPLKDLCIDGKLSSNRWTFSATSGTTGEPFYFPRTDQQDQQYALTAELYLRNNFKIQEKSTLYINAFAMGAWIGGVFTHVAITNLARSGKYKLSIISPGLNRLEIIKAVKSLGKNFDQVILGGYPPFIKDVLDEGVTQGLDWKACGLSGIVFSAEGFSESFRDYVLTKAGLDNPYTSTLNHYGTVDLGTMAHETPLSILIRRTSLDHPPLNSLIFPEVNRLPTFAQYDPAAFYFEQVGEGLLCSALSGLPLVRYDLKDRGGIIKYNSVSEKFTQAGISLDKLIRRSKIGKNVWTLPFVYVYERSDMVVSWSGANIYPEHLKEAHQVAFLTKFLTGKFTMEILHKKNHTPYLMINSELRRGVKNSIGLSNRLQKETLKILLEKNSEFKNNYNSSPKDNLPRVTLWPNESEPYFKPGGKQKWTIKS